MSLYVAICHTRMCDSTRHIRVYLLTLKTQSVADSRRTTADVQMCFLRSMIKSIIQSWIGTLNEYMTFRLWLTPENNKTALNITQMTQIFPT